MVLVRQFVHLTTHFFIASYVIHILAELLLADEPVVDTQIAPLLASLLERICDVICAVPWLLSVTVSVMSPNFVVIGKGEDVHGVLDVLSCFPHSRFARTARTCNRRCQCPSMIGILSTVLWVPYRVVHTIRCSQPTS